jgi:hypothetical protein
MRPELQVKTVNIPDTNVAVEMYLYDLSGNELLLENFARYVILKLKIISKILKKKNRLKDYILSF